MFIHSPQHLLNVHCRPLTEMKKPNLDLGVLKDITTEKYNLKQLDMKQVGMEENLKRTIINVLREMKTYFNP